MSKIEPMTIEEIKEHVKYPQYRTGLDGRLILAWAHERARANAFANLGNRDRHKRYQEVLDEIGWPKDGR